MIKTQDLKAEITRKNMTQQDVAHILGITPKTFYAKMKKGEFGSDEIKTMIDILNISNPMDIFFADEVTLKDTKMQNHIGGTT